MATIRRLKNKRFLAEIRKKGVYKSKTFDSKVQAMAWAAETEQSLANQHLIHGKTLADACLRYRDEISPKKKSYRTEYNRLNKFSRQPFASLTLEALTAKHLYDWIEDVSRTLKSSSVNRDLNLLSAVLEQAKRWQWTDKNPVRGLRRPKNPQPRDRRISAKEIQQVMDALGFDGQTINRSRHELAVAFLLAIETAMRQGELWQLKWEDVYLEKRYLRLHDTKNGTRRDVPLSSEAVRLFTLLQPGRGEKVFKSNQASSGTIFRRCLKQAGIYNMHFHDTRHEAISRLAQKIPVLDLARLTGHKDIKMLMVYYNASAEEIAKQLD
ncbi:site-specific integrase [Teredinibacter turnerae]|uniref:tyrosine-type recombinase/integrase n=1 Tax=Teredinibacter turnerae TaxID=2426 RepID=UPI00037A6673|nr:site-specific integrase [Teredinibacter turnerae]